MSWNGRSSLPALAGQTPATESPTFVTFAVPFDSAPDVQLPPTPEGVTASLGEVTPEGFVLIVERASDTEPAAIEWVATTAPSQED